MNHRNVVDPIYELILKMQHTHIPCHIAIIQDGNRRFAQLQGINAASGHRAGADTTERMLDWAYELGIRYITLYSFSTENLRRTKDELDELFSLFKERFLRVCSDERVHRYKIRVQMVGDRSLLPEDVMDSVKQAEEATKMYDRYFLNIALAYGGRNEIVHATRSILRDVEREMIKPEDIDISVVERHMYKGLQLPPVDLMIRTGSEKRTSNFLPWLANGNESAVYFCAPYWPLFRKIDLLRAIRTYDQRLKVASHLPKRRLRN